MQLLVLLLLFVCEVALKPKTSTDSFIQQVLQTSSSNDETPKYSEKELTSDYWRAEARETILRKLHLPVNLNVAKNVILFMGDGMSVPTLAAARAYLGQKNGQPGENSKLIWEEFPFTGLSKTYCVDYQVADSACAATAYLTGVKGNEGTIGVNARVPFEDCQAMRNASNHVYSLANWFQNAGKGSGFVTTTRVTHSSPAGVYAHTAHRDWESDSDIISAKLDPKECTDIGQQLILGETGSKLDVIMGGGRRMLLPKNFIDEEGQPGSRSDSQNLIQYWQKRCKANKKISEYVWNRDGLNNISPKTNKLLGLFESDHMQYHLDADPKTEPTLAEMVQGAIKVLQKNDKGFFLFVESGKIDTAHHETKAQKALDETVRLANAIEVALEMVNLEDTLFIVTADHSHTMTYAGYAKRGSPILGLAGTSNMDNLPYATLSYANGPSYETKSQRHNLTEDNMDDLDYKFPSTVPLQSETHGGEDVAVFAIGPWAHLFTGSYEQNVIPHMIAYASCVGDGLTLCNY